MLTSRYNVSMRILVADSDPSSTEMLVTYVASQGHEVVARHDFASALGVAWALRPHAAFLERSLAIADDQRLSKAVMASDGVTIILIRPAEIWQRPYTEGFFGCLEKPVHAVMGTLQQNSQLSVCPFCSLLACEAVQTGAPWLTSVLWRGFRL